VPNYEYRCTKCENQFEIWQEVGADAPPCPQCEGEVQKIFHPVRTIYKGSGFYITDTKKNTGSSSPTTSAPAPTPAPASTETKA